MKNILTNISPEEVNGAITSLKSLDLENADFEKVKEIVRILTRCGFMVVTFPVGKIIYRGRIMDITETVFKHKKDISYPPVSDKNKLKLNRASSNQFQIFYGAVGTPDLDDADVVAMTEITNVTSPSFNEDEYEYMALGQWFVKKEFTVASLALHSEIAKHNRQAQDMKKFHTEVSEVLKERGALVEQVAKFLSAEFEKKVAEGEDYQYKISASYGDLLFDLGIPGIMFPSVKGDGKTFNVALHKDVVDECLDLNVVAVAKSQKITGEHFVDWHLQSTWIDNGKFNWETPPTKSTISSYEKKLIIENIKENGKFVNPRGVKS